MIHPLQDRHVAEVGEIYTFPQPCVQLGLTPWLVVRLIGRLVLAPTFALALNTPITKVNGVNGFGGEGAGNNARGTSNGGASSPRES